MTKLKFWIVCLSVMQVWIAGAQAAKVALYNDSGVWKPSLRHTEKLLHQMQISTERVSAKDILNGRLRIGDIDALVVPGGKSWLYRDDLGINGMKEIRNFVYSGGGYIGFCAGAFLAVSHREGGNTTGPYGIGLLEGTAVDPASLNYPGYRSGMKTISFSLADFKESYKVIYLAGPIFKYSEQEANAKQIRQIAHYVDQATAAIYFKFGEGRVFISGPHPEVEERISLPLRIRYPDPDSEWPLVKSLVSNVLAKTDPVLR